MGKKTLLYGLISAGVGFVTAAYVLSSGNRSHLPALLVFVLCPAGLLGWLAPTAAPDSGLLWSVGIVNAIICGMAGLTCAMFFRSDDD